MARTAYKLHNPQITGSNNPAYQISKNAYDADHTESGMVGFVPSNKTLASNLIVVTDSVTTVDPQSGSTDNLDFIDYSNTNDKDILFILNHSGANTITAKHNVASPPAGSLSLFLLGAGDQVLSTTVPLVLMRIGTSFWYQIIPFSSGITNQANTWTANNTFTDSKFFIANSADATKLVKFDVSNIASGTTRTITIQNVNDTMAVLGTAQTWTAAQTHNANIIMNSANISLAGNSITTSTYTIAEVTGFVSGILTVQPTSGNNNGRFAVAPSGTTRLGQYVVYRTSDITTNYEALFIQSDDQATGEFAIHSTKGGSGTARAINVYMGSGATKLMSFDTANTITNYVDLNISTNKIKTTNFSIYDPNVQNARSANYLQIFNNTGGNIPTVIAMFAGTSNNSSWFEFNRLASPSTTNFETFRIGTDTQIANEMILQVVAGGTGSLRPINIYMSATKLMSFDTANTVTSYVTALFPYAAGTNVPSIGGQGSALTITTGSTSTPLSNANVFSGLIIVKNVTSGHIGVFITGGSQMVLISQDASEFVVSSSPSGTQTGVYMVGQVITMKNGFAGSQNYNVFSIAVAGSQ